MVAIQVKWIDVIITWNTKMPFRNLCSHDSNSPVFNYYICIEWVTGLCIIEGISVNTWLLILIVRPHPSGDSSAFDFCPIALFSITKYSLCLFFWRYFLPILWRWTSTNMLYQLWRKKYSWKRSQDPNWLINFIGLTNSWDTHQSLMLLLPQYFHMDGL